VETIRKYAIPIAFNNFSCTYYW